MENTKIERRCVIIGGGEMHNLREMFSNITEEDFVIAADSGYQHALEAHIKVDLFVGDFDSFNGTVESWIPVVLLPTHKDVTDMHAAILEGLRLGYRSFLMLGALGGRLDHSFANISLLKILMDHGAKGQIAFDQGTIFMIKNDEILFAKTDAYVSIFPFGGDACGVTLEGFEYPLNNATLTVDNPVGISNHIVELNGRVKVKDGTLIIMQVRE